MRLFATVTAILAVLLALFGWVAVSRRDQALDRTGSAAARLISVQEIRSAVIEADSIATTTFLVGGLEPADRRARFETRLSEAAGALALLFDGESAAARDQVTAASASLNRFSGLVEQARANNRQGFPVGAAYQRQASVLVRSELLISLDDLEQQARSDVNDNIASAHRIGWVLPIAGLIAVTAMAAGSWWLSRRTRRTVNVPLGLAGLITVVVVVFALANMSDAVSSADTAVNGDLGAADQLSQARVAAFEARSDEALTLINRGNGAANEADFQQAQARVRAVLDPVLRADEMAFFFNLEYSYYLAYADVHADVLDLDDDGDWDGAVELLLGRSADEFEVFSTEIETTVQNAAARAQADITDADSGLGGARWAVLIGAVAAAVLSAVGYGQRLREYR